MVPYWNHAKAIMKTQSKPKQLNEYRGLGATNEKGDLTKKRTIDKWQEWETHLMLFPWHAGRECTCRIDTCSVSCRVCEGRSCANSHKTLYKENMGSSPKCCVHCIMSSDCSSNQKDTQRLLREGAEKKCRVPVPIKKITKSFSEKEPREKFGS